jgi:hypothetical protein
MAMKRLVLDFDMLVERRLDRAEMLLRIAARDRVAAAVLDAATGELVLVPNQPTGWGSIPVALSPDGRTVLYRADNERTGARSLCVITLATGERRWFETSGDDFDVTAATSPDGRNIATITAVIGPGHSDSEDNRVAVDLIQLLPEERRRLWSTPGQSGDSSIHWSPDSRLVAASYITPDEEYTTVVIDIDARTTRRYPGAQLPFASNGTWLGDREFVYFTFDGVVTAHLDYGKHPLPPLGGPGGVPMAFTPGRIIRAAPAAPDSSSADVITTTIDGSDPQTIIAVRPAHHITLIDIAPSAAT